MPAYNSKGIVSGGLALLVIFTIFYFAIFSFTAPLAEIRRDMIEFGLVGSSLIISWLLFWRTAAIFAKRTKMIRSPTLGSHVVDFLIIYTLMMVILFMLKAVLLPGRDLHLWGYYWRHFPYACLIFGVYLYREYKKSEISRLVEITNTNIEQSQDASEQPESQAVEEPLIIQADGDYHKIYPSNISHISVDGHYLDIYHMKGDLLECVMTRKPLTQMIEDLPSPPFFRIHRSHIANLHHAIRINKSSKNYSISLVDDQHKLPISRSRLETILTAFETL